MQSTLVSPSQTTSEMACQKCAELSNTVEELWTHIQTKRVSELRSRLDQLLTNVQSQVIRDVVNLAAEVRSINPLRNLYSPLV